MDNHTKQLHEISLFSKQRKFVIPQPFNISSKYFAKIPFFEIKCVPQKNEFLMNEN